MSKAKTARSKTKKTPPKRKQTPRVAPAQVATLPEETPASATLPDDGLDPFESWSPMPPKEEQLDADFDTFDEAVDGNGSHTTPEGLDDYPWDKPWESYFAPPEEQFSNAPTASTGIEPVSALPEMTANTTSASESAAPAKACGRLIAHCGTRKIGRDELILIPVPEATRTHQPLAHHRIVEVLVESLTFRHIRVVREEYAVSPDGARMFGVLDLDAEWSGVRFSIGLRNANDKSMRLGMTVGYRVLVCDNMSFQGDFAPVFHKHTRKLDLLDVISIGVDKMQRSFAPLQVQIGEWQERIITDDTARLLIYRAFLEERFPRTIMAEVHRYYFEPQHEEFKARTLWSLSNAFTSAFKLLKPVRQFTATAKLGGYLSVTT